MIDSPGEHAVPTSETSDRPRRTKTVRIGFGLFLVGLVFLVVTVVPFFWGDHNRSIWLNLGCMLAPIGFVIAVTGVIRAGRAEQREALARVERAHSDR